MMFPIGVTLDKDRMPETNKLSFTDAVSQALAKRSVHVYKSIDLILMIVARHYSRV